MYDNLDKHDHGYDKTFMYLIKRTRLGMLRTINVIDPFQNDPRGIMDARALTTVFSAMSSTRGGYANRGI